MSRVGKLETIVEVKAPAAKIHEVFSCRPHIVTIRSPESVESCELLEGERGKPGRVICWRFCRGKPTVHQRFVFSYLLPAL